MRIRRQFTVEGRDPYDGISFVMASSEIRNPDGSVVFRQTDIEVPESWSQVACDVLAQKYFRKAGIPTRLQPVAEDGVPQFLWRKQADGPETTGEHSAKQVFDRLAGAWTYWGWKGGYFDGEADARAFYDELCHMLATRRRRRIPLNGSTRACTGPMGSMDRARATTMWITSPAA
jgi:ribonucleoside-diphosphate reductase alpha chain